MGRYVLAKYKNLPGVTVPKVERCKTEHCDTPGPLDCKDIVGM